MAWENLKWCDESDKNKDFLFVSANEIEDSFVSNLDRLFNCYDDKSVSSFLFSIEDAGLCPMLRNESVPIEGYIY